jgi:DNA polymerase/3'-5' exonuclease PolX
MSDNKTRHPHAAALAVAQELQAQLSPACHRIAIVGSLRRQRPLVGDVELLFISRRSERPEGLFDNRIVDVCSEVCDKLLVDGVLAKRPNVNGHFAWGESNKLAIHVASGIPIDLFRTTEENWPVSLVIRTGSKETNLKLTTGAMKQGGTLMAYGCGVKWSDGTITPATSEQHVFEMCRVPYKEPEDR